MLGRDTTNMLLLEIRTIINYKVMCKYCSENKLNENKRTGWKWADIESKKLLKLHNGIFIKKVFVASMKLCSISCFSFSCFRMGFLFGQNKKTSRSFGAN